MGINDQMRRGLAKVMALDSDTGIITRRAYADNGMGGQVPAGEALPPFTVTCRVSYEGGGVWHRGQWAGGLATDTTPCVFASPETDIRAEDLLEWRGRRYKVGAVTCPQLGGGTVSLQAPLTEVE
jgi:hypothetical protein